MSKRAVLSLFTGAGGLDLGLEAAGFSTALVVENDEDALETLRHNRPRWKISRKCDAIEFADNALQELKHSGLSKKDIVLLAGGPPCQPFSKAGNWTAQGPQRLADPRAETLRAYLRVVEAVTPSVLLLENVSGLAYQGRAEGLKLIARGIKDINRRRGTDYKLETLRINAADYGVPQFRERLFLIAHREGRSFALPAPTHGVSREAFHGRFLTAWDAIGGLDVRDRPVSPELQLSGRWADLLPSIPEGRNYLWHTPQSGGLPLFGWRTRYWSFLLKLAKDAPSWTISASPGPATGPFHWNNRLLSIEEMCSLQTFPNGYTPKGSRRTNQKQIGNAVPSALSEMLGLEIRRQLLGDKKVEMALSLLPERRQGTPDPEPVSCVPPRFQHLIGDHKAHPGTGLGPGRRKAAQ